MNNQSKGNKGVLIIAVLILGFLGIVASNREKKSGTYQSGSSTYTSYPQYGSDSPVSVATPEKQSDFREEESREYMQRVEQEYRDKMNKIKEEERRWNEEKRRMDARSSGNPYSNVASVTASVTDLPDKRTCRSALRVEEMKYLSLTRLATIPGSNLKGEFQ